LVLLVIIKTNRYCLPKTSLTNCHAQWDFVCASFLKTFSKTLERNFHCIFQNHRKNFPLYTSKTLERNFHCIFLKKKPFSKTFGSNFHCAFIQTKTFRRDCHNLPKNFKTFFYKNFFFLKTLLVETIILKISNYFQ